MIGLFDQPVFKLVYLNIKINLKFIDIVAPNKRNKPNALLSSVTKFDVTIAKF